MQSLADPARPARAALTPCANRAPRDQVRDVLRRDCVEQLAACGEAHLGNLEEEAAGEAEPLVDLEAAVELGVCRVNPGQPHLTDKQGT